MRQTLGAVVKGVFRLNPPPNVSPPGWMIGINLLSQWRIQAMILLLDYGSAVS
jgi:hypothetical protein